jgi:hypothetical protein
VGLRIVPTALCLLLVTACSFPGSVKPTVKIGLSAPFEGQYRDLGYEALYAVRLAVRERNAGGGVGQRFLVELVALNDFNEADKAVEQARKMAVDPAVLGVIGGWSPETALAAGEYERLGLSFLTPDIDTRSGDILVAVDADSAAAFGPKLDALSGDTETGPVAVWAYSSANRLMDAIDAAVRAGGRPTRADVGDALE